MHINYENHHFTVKRTCFSKIFFLKYFLSMRNSTTIWDFEWDVRTHTYVKDTVVLRSVLTSHSFWFVTELSCNFEGSRNWQNLTEICRNWQKLADIDRNWQKLAEIGRNWQTSPTSVNFCQFLSISANFCQFLPTSVNFW